MKKWNKLDNSSLFYLVDFDAHLTGGDHTW